MAWLNSFKLFIFLMFLGFSNSSWANTCFADAAEGGLTSDEEITCYRSILGASANLDVSVNITGLENYRSLVERIAATNPTMIRTDPVFATLSTSAAGVFYSNSLCGDSVNTPEFCENMRRLALIHEPSGNYVTNYCRRLGSAHEHCTQYVESLHAAIEGWSGNPPSPGLSAFDCTGATVNRLYCDDVVTSMLATAKCNDVVTRNDLAVDCGAYATERFSASGACTMEMWSGMRAGDSTAAVTMSSCAGTPEEGPAPPPPPAAIAAASVDTTGPSGGDITGPTGGGDDPVNDPPTPSEEDPTADLTALADNVAASTFGGMPANFSMNSMDATSQVPGVEPDGPSGGGISAAGEARMGGFNHGNSTAVSPLSRVLPPTRGNPGGSDQGPSAAGGSPGGGPGGGVAGGSGINSGSGANGAGGSKRRRGGVSRYKSLSDRMNKGNHGTDVPPSGGAGAESAIDKQVKQALADRERAAGAAGLDRNALQDALNRNLGQTGGNNQDMLMRASYFPGHSEVYIWMHQRSDLLDEQGK